MILIRGYFQKTGLIIISILVAFFLTEISYRLYVFLTYEANGVEENNYIYVLSDQIVVFDKSFGYSYSPNKELYIASIRDNRIEECRRFHRINPFGTFEIDFADFRSARANIAGDPRILVFGDSCTAKSHGGETWVSLFSRRLKRVMPNSQVLNFGRDGYGILQMVELAAGKIDEWKPDVILIVFITDDIHRRKFWRKNSTGNPGFWYITFDPDDDETSVDTLIGGYFDRRISAEFCETVSKNGGIHPMIEDVVALDRRLRDLRQSKNAPKMITLESYILNLVLRGKPVLCKSRWDNESFSFKNSVGFRTAMEKLNESKVPYYFVHLPIASEINKGSRWLPPSDAEYLLRELYEMTAEKGILYLGDYMKLSGEQLALYPVSSKDEHPSKDGIGYIADAMVQLYFNRDMISTFSPPWQGSEYTAQRNKSPRFESSEGWGPGYAKAKAKANGSGVVVGPGPLNENVFAQRFHAKPGEHFKIVARASAVDKMFGLLDGSKATGRIQINWVGPEGSFISASIMPIEVTSEERMFEHYTAAPVGVVAGYLYVAPHGADDVVRYTEMRLLGKPDRDGQ